MREELGRSEECVALPEPARIDALVAALCDRGPQWVAAFAPGRRVRAACNQRFIGPDAAIEAGDEIAFFPPVTGG
nr:MoaD/ThiS family protein [Endobacter medicaginis]MCX5474368.1 MoaD/ThiS family protein [Endobacter medicaginis]